MRIGLMSDGEYFYVQAENEWRSGGRSHVTAPYRSPPRLPNDAQKHIHWCGRCPDVCACNCAGHRSMPVPGAPLQFLNPLGEFYRRCFYHSIEGDLRAGRSMSTVIDGKIVSVVEARRMVAHARAQGWLSPEAACDL